MSTRQFPLFLFLRLMLIIMCVFVQSCGDAVALGECVWHHCSRGSLSLGLSRNMSFRLQMVASVAFSRPQDFSYGVQNENNGNTRLYTVVGCPPRGGSVAPSVLLPWSRSARTIMLTMAYHGSAYTIMSSPWQCIHVHGAPGGLREQPHCPAEVTSLAGWRCALPLPSVVLLSCGLYS